MLSHGFEKQADSSIPLPAGGTLHFMIFFTHFLRLPYIQTSHLAVLQSNRM